MGKLHKVLYLRASSNHVDTYYLNDNMATLRQSIGDDDDIESITCIRYDFKTNQNVPFDFSEFDFDIFYFDCADGMGVPTLEETLEKLQRFAERNPDKRFYVFSHMPYPFDRAKFRRGNLSI